MATHLLVGWQLTSGLAFGPLVVPVLCVLNLQHEAIHRSVMYSFGSLHGLF